MFKIDNIQGNRMGLGDYMEKRRKENAIRDRTEKARQTREYNKNAYDMPVRCLQCNNTFTFKLPKGTSAESILDGERCPNCGNANLAPMRD